MRDVPFLSELEEDAEHLLKAKKKKKNHSIHYSTSAKAHPHDNHEPMRRLPHGSHKPPTALDNTSERKCSRSSL